MKKHLLKLNYLIFLLLAHHAYAQTVNNQIKVFRNMRYADQLSSTVDTSSDRTLDVYIPKMETKKKLPIFLFVHGGGFKGGDKAQNIAICNKFAERGYAVVSINYRLWLKGNKIPGADAMANMAKGLPIKPFHEDFKKAIDTAVEDTKLVLQWIKNNKKSHNFDTKSLVIAGGSAGAITALYTAYASDQKIIPIKAVVNLWGGMENSQVIKAGAPPLLTFHGSKDNVINVAFAYDLHKRMMELGNEKSEMHIIEDKGHAIYNIIMDEKMDTITNFLNKVL